MRRFLSLSLILTGLLPMLPVTLKAGEMSSANLEYRAWVNEMRELERGPFSRSGGSARMVPCYHPSHTPVEIIGGGYQHGEWSKKDSGTASAGFYLVANVLAESRCATPGSMIPVSAVALRDPDRERFLIGADMAGTWQALFYRGAIQEEDERLPRAPC